jgi:sirohydrochlorin cobaltochelatase
MPMLAENPAIVLASYGSAYPGALTTYEQIKSAYERAFPGSLVRLAFTSQSMRLRLAENEGRRIPSPLAALAELQDQGQRDVIVQSLHIVPGEEFHQLAALVQGLKRVKGKFGFEHLELGLPLLSSLEDCRATAAALAAIIDGLSENKVSGQGQSREAKEEAVLFAGHGTGHPADGLYSLMASVLAKDCCNVFLGTLEGFPGITELMPRLQRSGVKKVWLLPFLLVAGGHALKDIAGSGPKSWKSLLEREGFQVGVHLQASGENEVILKIFQQHTREAMEKRFQHKLKD